MSIEPEQELEQPQKRSILRRTLSIGLELILLLIVVVMVDAWMTRNSAHGTPPPLEGRTITGNHFSLNEFNGDVSLLHFWGSWCPVCNLEQGTIDSLNKDFQLMSVALQSGSNAEIGQYLLDKGVNYPVLNDDSGELSSRYGVSSVPVTFVLDSRGDIRYVTRGYSSELGLRFRLWLASL